LTSNIHDRELLLRKTREAIVYWEELRRCGMWSKSMLKSLWNQWLEAVDDAAWVGGTTSKYWQNDFFKYFV
jgi:hypothetical protein